jgi:hypothetical protein
MEVVAGSGIETPVRFRSLHSDVFPAGPRIRAARSQKQSQIGTAGVKRPSYLPERTARWTSDLISAVGKRTT